MSDIGLVWIREDFRIENNAALSYATQNHKNVVATTFLWFCVAYERAALFSILKSSLIQTKPISDII